VSPFRATPLYLTVWRPLRSSAPTFVQLPDGEALPSRNLTPDPTTGLGSYTAAQIKHMFLDGMTVRGVDAGTQALNPTMPYYVFHNMASDDADAIVAYLQSIPAVHNPIPPRSPAKMTQCGDVHSDMSSLAMSSQPLSFTLRWEICFVAMRVSFAQSANLL